MASPRIVTVLRSGGEFRPEHVERLRDQCARHAPGVPFVCVSDALVPGHTPLRHDWPGWWSKIEAFRLRGPMLLVDLDTTICGDLAPLLDPPADWITLRDFNAPRAPREVASGLMFWRGDALDLYETFRADPAQHMSLNRTPQHWGDGGFIARHAEPPTFWQDVLPGAVVSWKKHCAGGVPAGARVVCFHGAPRPWEVETA